MRILDWWTPLDPASYDVVCALDVFEHIPDLPETVERVVNALADGGALVESSPFVVNESNPMHHDDPGFDDLLRAHALDLAHAADDHRFWRKSPR